MRARLKMEGRIPGYEIARSALGNHDSETDECQSSPRNAPTGFCGVPADSSDFHKLGIRPLDDIEPWGWRSGLSLLVRSQVEWSRKEASGDMTQIDAEFRLVSNRHGAA